MEGVARWFKSSRPEYNNIMKYALILLLLTSCQMQSNLGLVGGIRDFNDTQGWEQTDRQDNLYGLHIDYAGRNELGLEVGITHSEDVSSDDTYVNRSVNDTLTTTNEVYFGLRKNLMLAERLQASLSGGLSHLIVRTHVDLSYAGTPVDHDQSYVPYLGLGTSWYVTNHFTVGLAYRRTFFNEEADIFIVDPDLDSDTYMLVLGWSF